MVILFLALLLYTVYTILYNPSHRRSVGQRRERLSLVASYSV